MLKGLGNLSSSSGSGLSDAKIGSGLQEALKVGTENAVVQTGTTDGFLMNKAIKILMPKSLQTIEKPLRMVGSARSQFGRIDVLHYNVGFSIAGGDASPTEITEEAFDRITAVNLRGCVMAVKHVLPVMRAQQSGVILTISSLAAYEIYPYVTYKATKAAMIAFTQQVAIQNASYGVRANCILPGLMDTPMAVDTRARATGKPRAEVAAARDAKVPLRGKMGTAWDVANAALFLASDEANFITGVALPVDGGFTAH